MNDDPMSDDDDDDTHPHEHRTVSVSLRAAPSVPGMVAPHVRSLLAVGGGMVTKTENTTQEQTHVCSFFRLPRMADAFSGGQEHTIASSRLLRPLMFTYSQKNQNGNYDSGLNNARSVAVN